jgi:catechol 2,3-dioxygenase-like lactoylglutathione lyase family enzyme
MFSRLVGIALICSVVQPLAAQEPLSVPFTLDHVALSVADLKRSADFYHEVFGLPEITNRTKVDGIRWFSLGQGKELHLISIVKGPVSLNKAVHFALTTSDFDGFVERLRNRGIKFSNWNGDVGVITARADGILQIYLQDPDGYWIEVNSTGAAK